MEANEIHEDPWSRALYWSAFAIFVGFVLNPALLMDHAHSSSASARINCISDLRTIQGAKETWATENAKGSSAIPTTNDLFGETLYVRRMPVCRFGGTYTLNAVNQKPTCSIPYHTL